MQRARRRRVGSIAEPTRATTKALQSHYGGVAVRHRVGLAVRRAVMIDADAR
jgi:hypothetical protein